MKKTLLIISILLIISLSGCGGVYDLSGFVLPDDFEFLAVIDSLDTPLMISHYLQDNFEYKENLFYHPDPYTFWKIKEGDCNDFSTFGVFAANYNGYETYQIYIYYQGSYGVFKYHIMAIYIEDKISFTDNWVYRYGFNSFREIVDANMEFRPVGWVWSKYIVYDYGMNVIEVGNKK